MTGSTLHRTTYLSPNPMTGTECGRRENEEDCRLMTSLMHGVNSGSHDNENNCRRVQTQRRVSVTSWYTRTTADGRRSFSLVYNTGVNPAAVLGHVVSRAGGSVMWRIKMIDGGTFGLAGGIVAGRRSSSLRAWTSPRPSRLPRRANRVLADNDHQNNANFIRSRCDRVSTGKTRCFPFDLWPLLRDTDIHRFGVGQLLKAAGCRVQFGVAAAAAAMTPSASSPACCCCHSYFIAYDNARCPRLEFRSPPGSYCTHLVLFMRCREGGMGREEVSMTGIGFISLKRAVIT